MRLKIWFEFLTEFRNKGYAEASICDLWKVAEMFLDGESFYTGQSLGEANGYLPEKYNTPLNI